MTTYLAGTIQIRFFSMAGHRKVMNDSNRNTMIAIRDFFWPLHFMTVAYTRYAGVFAKRTKRYQIMKARIVHHQRPNEFTGALKEAVLMDSVPSATASRGTLTAKAPADSVILSGPRAGQRIRRPLNEQRRKELEYVSPEEIEVLIQRQQAEYRAAVYDPAYQETLLAKFK